MSIADNLNRLRTRIAEIAATCGRRPEEVALIAVSKTKGLDLIQEAVAAGQLDFGENYVQELKEKNEQLPDVHWHQIGALQRNKVKYIAPFIHLVHSVDSERLLGEIDKQAAKCNRIIDCLLQIHISEEANKSGMDESEAQHILEHIDDYPHIRILGLMGMAALTEDAALIRSQFRRLKQDLENFQRYAHPRIQLRELSMGMSGDYEIAIEEGATMIRVGSAIFGERNYVQ